MASRPGLGPSLRYVKQRIVTLGTAAFVSFALIGCGGGDTEVSFDPDDGVVDGSITVIGTDIDFDAGSYGATAGPVEITLANEGSLLHTLVVEDVDGMRLVTQSKGDSDSGTVDLESGEYVIYCDIAGHRGAGMEATLTVE